MSCICEQKSANGVTSIALCSEWNFLALSPFKDGEVENTCGDAHFLGPVEARAYPVSGVGARHRNAAWGIRVFQGAITYTFCAVNGTMADKRNRCYAKRSYVSS